MTNRTPKPKKRRGRSATSLTKQWNSRAILWPCKDCGCDVAPVRNGKRSTWGVKDKVWRAAGMRAQGETPLGSGEFLCIKCIKARLGRALELWDFTYGTDTSVSRERWRGWLSAARTREATP